jgi:hypothetical protein
MITLLHKDLHAATRFDLPTDFNAPTLRSVIRRLITNKRVKHIVETRKLSVHGKNNFAEVIFQI